MLELLIIGVCLNGTGCNETASAYYAYNKDLRDLASNIERKANAEFGKENLAIVGTMAGLVFVKKGTVVLQRNVNLIANTNQAVLQYHMEF
jgi:hypothetical protein